MKILNVDNSGSRPKMVPDESPEPVPGGCELLVKIEAASLNRADLMQKSGKYPPPEGAPDILGLEMAGKVVQTGPGAEKFKRGDLVFGLLPGGGYAEYCTLHEKIAMAMPDFLSFEEAAAIPEAFLTAWQALDYLGCIQPRNTVLIHAGASGVGTAAIQLAGQVFQNTVITTAGRDEKLDICTDLGADMVINYKKDDFAEVIRQKLGRDSIPLILDFIGAPYWERNIDCLAMDGRLVLLSMLGGVSAEELNLVPLLRKRLTVTGSTLRNRTDGYKAKLTADFYAGAMPFFIQGRLKPVIHSVFDWTEVEKAHALMANNENTGKIVLTGM
ncbi:MAG: NAD(P)H-quinone oxidoreductase [Balneolaceae bacterium]